MLSCKCGWGGVIRQEDTTALIYPVRSQRSGRCEATDAQDKVD